MKSLEELGLKRTEKGDQWQTESFLLGLASSLSSFADFREDRERAYRIVEQIGATIRHRANFFLAYESLNDESAMACARAAILPSALSSLDAMACAIFFCFDGLPIRERQFPSIHEDKSLSYLERFKGDPPNRTIEQLSELVKARNDVVHRGFIVSLESGISELYRQPLSWLPKDNFDKSRPFDIEGLANFFVNELPELERQSVKDLEALAIPILSDFKEQGYPFQIYPVKMRWCNMSLGSESPTLHQYMKPESYEQGEGSVEYHFS